MLTRDIDIELARRSWYELGGGLELWPTRRSKPVRRLAAFLLLIGTAADAGEQCDGAAAAAHLQLAQAMQGSNPMRPGWWEFTRAGGMAATRLGKFCVTAAQVTDPRSAFNGYLKAEHKAKCASWQIAWQDGRAEYQGECDGIKYVGAINASAEYYSDEQRSARDESGWASAVKDIINGRRLGDCQN